MAAYDELLAVGSGGFNHEAGVVEGIRETMCIRCRIRPHSEYDMYHCERCKPR